MKPLSEANTQHALARSKLSSVKVQQFINNKFWLLSPFHAYCKRVVNIFAFENENSQMGAAQQ